MIVQIVYHSMHGPIKKMADAVAEGARQVEGADVRICRVKETLPDEVLKKMAAYDTQKMFADDPVCTPDDLRKADAVIFGSPTRYGSVTAQMRQFLDSTGKLWASGALIGKVGSAFTGSATQHGGQESTILGLYTTLLHHGMVIAGLPYSFQKQMTLDEITGGSPYGASTISGGMAERMPSENELEGARFQGRHVAEIAKKLSVKQ